MRTTSGPIAAPSPGSLSAGPVSSEAASVRLPASPVSGAHLLAGNPAGTRTWRAFPKPPARPAEGDSSCSAAGSSGSSVILNIQNLHISVSTVPAETPTSVAPLLGPTLVEELEPDSAPLCEDPEAPVSVLKLAGKLVATGNRLGPVARIRRAWLAGLRAVAASQSGLEFVLAVPLVELRDRFVILVIDGEWKPKLARSLADLRAFLGTDDAPLCIFQGFASLSEAEAFCRACGLDCLPQ